MERATRAQGHSLVRSAQAASNLPARTSKVPYLLSQGAVSLTASGLELAVKKDMFAGTVVEQVSVKGLVYDLNLIFLIYRDFHCHPMCLPASQPTAPLPWGQLG